MGYTGRRGYSRGGDAVLAQTMARVMLFPALLFYLELVLHISKKNAMVYIPVYLVFSVAGGLFLSVWALPWRRRANSLAAKILALLLSVLYGVEYIAKTILQSYYGPSALDTAANNKLTDYAPVIISTVIKSIPILLVILLPAILLCVFGNRLLGFERLDIRFAGLVLAGCVMFHIAGLGVLHLPWTGDWSIREIDEQVERVRKGWFPANPKRAARRSEP